MRDLLKQSKVQLSFFLFTIYILNLATHFSVNALISVPIAVFSALCVEYLSLKIRKVKFFFPSAAIATGFIIGLLTDPNLPLYIPAIVSSIAILGKNFIRIKRHIFNPAAFALIIVSLFTGVAVSWWGVSWQIPDPKNLLSLVAFLILLSAGYVSLVKMKRWRIAVAFLATYTIATAFIVGKPQLLFLDPIILFFAFIMLPEPMTSPNNSVRQFIYGSFVGITAVALSVLILTRLNLFNLDPVLLALLVGNLIFFKYR